MQPDSVLCGPGSARLWLQDGGQAVLARIGNLANRLPHMLRFSANLGPVSHRRSKYDTSFTTCAR
jgi:hypothetical protein